MRKRLGIAVAALLLGLARANLALHGSPLKTGEYTLRGTVASTPNVGFSTQTFLFDIGQDTMLASATADAALCAGDFIELHGTVRPIVPYSDDPSGGLLANYWLRRGITRRISTAWIGGLRIIEPGGGIASIGGAWRNRTWELLRSQLDADRAGIAMGIVAGQQSLVDPGILRDMTRSGTLHLIATSGYNVMLLAGLAFMGLSALPIHRSVQILLVVLVLIVYLAAVGDRPSILRATIMAVVMLCAYIFDRAPDVLSALAFAAVVCALIQPASVFDAGYQLSFIVLLALALYGPACFDFINRKTAPVSNAQLRWFLRWALAIVGTTLLCELGAAPILAAHFGQVSVVAPVANLLTVVAVPAVYAGVFLSQIFAPLLPGVSDFVAAWVVGPASGWIETCNRALAKPVWAAATFSPIPGWVAALAVACIVLFSRPRGSVRAFSTEPG